MEKIKTFTMSGQGDQDLIMTEAELHNAICELKALEWDEQDEEDGFREITIRIEKKYTQKEIEELPDYTG